jgi:hypothetical protein
MDSFKHTGMEVKNCLLRLNIRRQIKQPVEKLVREINLFKCD